MSVTDTDLLRSVLSHFPGARRVGDHHVARCPAHEDRNASLSIRTGRDGRVLLHCHAGCTADSVRRAAGLEWTDLFPPCNKNGNGSRYSGNGQQRIVTTYDYASAEGELIYQVVRYAPKGFSQRRPNGSGGWIENMHGVHRVLYRLGDLIDADPDATVYVAEGEKDVDALGGLGLIATCNVGGALKWRDEYSETLRGRAVCIIADRDERGRAHARQVAASAWWMSAPGHRHSPDPPTVISRYANMRRRMRWCSTCGFGPSRRSSRWCSPGSIPSGSVI